MNRSCKTPKGTERSRAEEQAVNDSVVPSRYDAQVLWEIVRVQRRAYATDRRRKRWQWAMPRDQWEMFRGLVDCEAKPLIRPSAQYPHGTMAGHPIVIDNNVSKLVLRVPRE